MDFLIIISPFIFVLCWVVSTLVGENQSFPLQLLGLAFFIIFFLGQTLTKSENTAKTSFKVFRLSVIAAYGGVLGFIQAIPLPIRIVILLLSLYFFFHILLGDVVEKN